MLTHGVKSHPAPIFLIKLGTALLALGAVASLLASPDPSTSAPWALLTVAGTALVWVAADRGEHSDLRALAAIRFVLISGYLSLLALPLLTDWPTRKLPVLAPLYRWLPSLLPLAPDWLAQGLSPNQTGGVLAACVAVAATLFIPWRSYGPVDARLRALRRAALPLLAIGVPMVLATGSRAALAGLLAAVFVALVIVDSRFLWAVPATAAATIVVAAAHPGGPAGLLRGFLHDEPVQTKLLARVDIWESALKGIADHPYAGIGPGTLNQVLPVRYPYRVVGIDYTVTQAHNIVLDTALSMGLIAAIGLVLTLAGAVWWGLRHARIRPRSGPRATGARCFVALLLTFMVFGITDALSFASPASLVFWISLNGLLWMTPTGAARAGDMVTPDPFSVRR